MSWMTDLPFSSSGIVTEIVSDVSAEYVCSQSVEAAAPLSVVALTSTRTGIPLGFLTAIEALKSPLLFSPDDGAEKTTTVGGTPPGLASADLHFDWKNRSASARFRSALCSLVCHLGWSVKNAPTFDSSPALLRRVRAAEMAKSGWYPASAAINSPILSASFSSSRAIFFYEIRCATWKPMRAQLFRMARYAISLATFRRYFWIKCCRML